MPRSSERNDNRKLQMRRIRFNSLRLVNLAPQRFRNRTAKQELVCPTPKILPPYIVQRTDPVGIVAKSLVSFCISAARKFAEHAEPPRSYGQHDRLANSSFSWLALISVG